MDPAIGAMEGKSTIVTLGNIRDDGQGHYFVSILVGCGNVCGSEVTLVMSNIDGQWIENGETGVRAVS